VIRLDQILEIDAVPKLRRSGVVASHAAPFAPEAARLLRAGQTREIFSGLLG